MVWPVPMDSKSCSSHCISLTRPPTLSPFPCGMSEQFKRKLGEWHSCGVDSLLVEAVDGEACLAKLYFMDFLFCQNNPRTHTMKSDSDNSTLVTDTSSTSTSVVVHGVLTACICTSYVT